MGRAESKRWLRRVPEPLSQIEGAEEYSDLVDLIFQKSDHAFARLVASKVPPNFKGLTDIGSGNGDIIRRVAQMRPDIKRFTCFDCSQEMLDLSRERIAASGVVDMDRVRFVQGDMTQISQKLTDGLNEYYIWLTSPHSLRTTKQFFKTCRGVARLIGPQGGGFFRELILPESEEDAERKREGALGPLWKKLLTTRQIQLFRNSQRAGYPYHTYAQGFFQTIVRNRAEVWQSEPPEDRYINAEVIPLVI